MYMYIKLLANLNRLWWYTSVFYMQDKWYVNTTEPLQTLTIDFKNIDSIMSASEWFFCVESLEFHSVIAKADDNTFFLLLKFNYT